MPRHPATPLRFATGPTPSGGLTIPTNDALVNGFKKKQRPPAQWVNWLFNATGEWLDYLRAAGLADWRRSAWGTTALSGLFVSMSAGVDLGSLEAQAPLRRWVIACNDGGTLRVMASARGDMNYVERDPQISGAPITSAGASSAFLAFGGATLAPARWQIAYTDTGSLRVITTLPDGTTGSKITTAGNWAVATGLSGSGLWSAFVGASSGAEQGVVVGASGASLWYSYVAGAFAGATLGTAPTASGVFVDVAWTGSAWVAVTDQGEVYRATMASDAWASIGVPGALAAGAWQLAVGADCEVIAYRTGGTGALGWARSTDHGATWSTLAAPAGLWPIARLRWLDGQWLLSTGENAPFLASASDSAGPFTRLAVPFVDDGTSPQLVSELLYGEGQLLALGRDFTLASTRARAVAGGSWVPSTTPMPTMDATYLRGRLVASTAPTDGQALVWNVSDNSWEPAAVLPVVATLTSSATLSSTELARCDTTSGALTLTLPTAPASGTSRIARRVAGSNGVTVARGGSDTILDNANASQTSVTWTDNATHTLVYHSGVWTVL